MNKFINRFIIDEKSGKNKESTLKSRWNPVFSSNVYGDMVEKICYIFLSYKLSLHANLTGLITYMRINTIHRFLIISVSSIFFFTSIVFAQDEKTVEIGWTKSRWTVLGGYGVTHPGFSRTRTVVETVDLMLSRGQFFTEEIGKSWYRGRHEIAIEIPFHLVVNPETTLMAGINLLGYWNMTAFSEKIVPYLLAGGGLIYTELDVPELGSKLNGNYQAGVGFHYFINKDTSIDFNYRYHHISNAGTAEPNDPLNSSKILMGISFFR